MREKKPGGSREKDYGWKGGKTETARKKRKLDKMAMCPQSV